MGVLDSLVRGRKAIGASTLQKVSGPNWFGRHFNWVAVLSWVALYPLGYVTGVLIISISPYMSTGIYYSIVFIIAALWLFGIDGWVLRKE